MQYGIVPSAQTRWTLLSLTEILGVPNCFCSQLSKRYGPVFTVHMGPNEVVVPAGYAAVKEALMNHADEFGERQPPRMLHEIGGGHGKGGHERT